MKSSKNMKYELVASFLFSWCGGEQTNDDDDDDDDDDDGGDGDGDEGDEDDEGCRTWWTYGGWLMIDGWWINITTIMVMIFWLYIVANALKYYFFTLMMNIGLNFALHFTRSIANTSNSWRFFLSPSSQYSFGDYFQPSIFWSQLSIQSFNHKSWWWVKIRPQSWKWKTTPNEEETTIGGNPFFTSMIMEGRPFFWGISF